MASLSAAGAGAENEKGDVAGLYPLSYQHGALNDQPPFDTEDERPTNEYVLNVAFFSFFGFMILQAVFALMVNSESMLADTEAMVRYICLLLNTCQSSVSQRRYLPQGRRRHDVLIKSLC
jgi:Co/Zn/Cd efflux system component